MPSLESVVRMKPAVPAVVSVLEVLPQPRLLDLARLFGCEVHEPGIAKERLIARLEHHLQTGLPVLLGELSRDELRLICRRRGLDHESKLRSELTAGILTAAGIDPKASVHPVQSDHLGLPREGQVLHARHRQWLVTGVVPGESGESPLVRLVCLDDDDPGRELEILWDLEIGAQLSFPKNGLNPVLDLAREPVLEIGLNLVK
jgi:hypothetical protein